MYKFIFMGIFLFLVCSTAVAQPYQANKPVVCDNLETVFNILTKEYGENVKWAGNDLKNDSKYALLVNDKTGTWSFVQFDNKQACILGVGKKPGNLTGFWIWMKNYHLFV